MGITGVEILGRKGITTPVVTSTSGKLWREARDVNYRWKSPAWHLEESMQQALLYTLVHLLMDS